MRSSGAAEHEPRSVGEMSKDELRAHLERQRLAHAAKFSSLCSDYHALAMELRALSKLALRHLAGEPVSPELRAAAEAGDLP